jgi:hypothetical protein
MAGDLQSVNAVISDPQGNWRFKTDAAEEASADTMAGSIAQAASEVSQDGTLLVYITAHGAPNGAIETNFSGGYANFGYENILQAIANGRRGQPFRRLVLIVSACYSGSWFDTLRSSGGLFSERLVISSVGSNELSNIGQATASMLSAFQATVGRKGMSLRGFLDTARSYDPSIQYAATSEAMLDESLIDPTGAVKPADAKPVSSAATVKPSADAGPAAGGSGAVSGAASAAASASTAPTGPGDVRVMTKRQGAQLLMYIYAAAKVTGFSVYSPVNGNWYPSTLYYAPQANGWETIQSLPVADGWEATSSAYVGVNKNGVWTQVQVAISHH